MGFFDFFCDSKENNNLKVGDRVYIRWSGQTGYVIDIMGSMVQVSITKEDGTDVVKTYSIDEIELAKGII